VDGAPLYALEIGGRNGSVVCDRIGRSLAFTDAATCAAVASFLAGAGYPQPLRAPVPISGEAGARVIATDVQAHAALLELLDDLAALRARVAEIASRC
jgi:hypothetical protein